MNVTEITGLYKAAEFGKMEKVKPTTIRDRALRSVIVKIKLGEIRFYYDPKNPPAWPAGVSPYRLMWIYRAGKPNHISPHVLYEAVINGKFPAYIVGGHVFVNTQDPAFIEFVKGWKQKRP